MRAYVDRHSRDPERRRARLTRIAIEMPRRRKEPLSIWLVAELRAAMAARACALWRKDGDWRPWQVVGVGERQPEGKALAHLADEPLRLGSDLLVPVAGSETLLGALFVEEIYEPDPSCLALLSALVGAAGVLLEQEVSAEALRYDASTGLLNEPSFREVVERALVELAPAHTPLLVAFRVQGIEAIRDAFGMRAAQAALSKLGRAAARYFPAQALGVRFDVVLALHTTSSTQIDAEMTAYTRTVDAALRQAASEAGGVTAAAVYRRLGAEPKLGEAIDELCRRAPDAPAGAAMEV